MLGGIGIGSRGEFDLNWMLREKDVQFVAICDARKVRREAVKQIVDKHYGNSDCKMYPEMREFLAEPRRHRRGADRHRRPLALPGRRSWRCAAGKDVYSEKPSCMTIAEGRHGRRDGPALSAAIYQTGVQRLSEANFVAAIELARTGRLGKVHTVRAHIAPWDAAEMSHAWLPEEPQPAKEEVDWDAWLGPCPWRPYNSTYVRGGWRGHYDFHTSCIGEWGAHTFAQSQAGIDALTTSAVEYHYVNNADRRRHGRPSSPTACRWSCREATSTGTAPAACGSRGRRAGSPWRDGYKQPEVSSPALLDDGDKLVADYMERTGRPMNHVRNFFDCVKSREPTVANPEVMHHSMSTVHAANICMWLKRDLKYDPVKEKFDDPEANRLLSRAQREPWIY